MSNLKQKSGKQIRPPRRAARNKKRKPGERAQKRRGHKEILAARRKAAWEYRMAGATYRQIAEKTGVSVQVAYDDIQFALKELEVLEVGMAKEYKRLWLGRLESELIAVWPQARAGNEKAQARVDAIFDREARLLGLFSPDKHEVSGPDGEPLKFVIIEPVAKEENALPKS